MNINVEEFFKPINLNKAYSKFDYDKIDTIIEFAKSISKLSYQSIYLIDYFKKGFIYVSDNPIFLCGESSIQVLKSGYTHYLKYVPKDDLEMLLEINLVGHKFYKELPMAEKLDYYISYDFRLKQPHGHPILINHKLKPILLDDCMNPWIALSTVSISSNIKSGNVYFKNNNSKKLFNYDFVSKSWSPSELILLKDFEKEILLYSAQGLTMEQIADRLFLSVDTIKYYKKSIFSKLKVKSISEALAKSLELMLL